MPFVGNRFLPTRKACERWYNEDHDGPGGNGTQRFRAISATAVSEG